MEKDKLDEGRKTFNEDKEKYEKFKMDLQAKSHQTEEEVRKVQSQIESLQNLIHELKKEDAEYESKMSKVEEEITLHKQHKKFLDLIAISSKNKKSVNQKQRNYMKMMREQQEHQDGEYGERQTFTNNYTNQRGGGSRVNDATFLT